MGADVGTGKPESAGDARSAGSARATGEAGGAESLDFFISHAGPDRPWAEWVAWQLDGEGYSVELAVWDWGVGANVVTSMSRALARAHRVLALFSSAYFEPGRFTEDEWTAVMALPNREGRLIPFRIEPLAPGTVPGPLRPLRRLDLFGLPRDRARKVLLDAVSGRGRPDREPDFPGQDPGSPDGDGDGAGPVTSPPGDRGREHPDEARGKEGAGGDDVSSLVEALRELRLNREEPRDRWARKMVGVRVPVPDRRSDRDREPRRGQGRDRNLERGEPRAGAREEEDGAPFVRPGHDRRSARGTAAWVLSTAGPVLSAPVPDGGTAYVSGPGHVRAIAAATGLLTWAFPTGADPHGPPVVARGAVYVAADDRCLYALDAADGSPRWRFPLDGGPASSPLVHEGTVYVADDQGTVYAVGSATGRETWRSATRCPAVGSPVVRGATVYLTVSNHSLHALDTGNGRRRWMFTAGGGLASPPVVDDGTVYVTSLDHHVYALDAGTGRPRWRFATGDRVASPPVLHRGAVHAASEDGHVYAVLAGNGRESWKAPVPGLVTSAPAVRRGSVYVGTHNHRLAAFNASDGRPRWTVLTSGRVVTSPVVHDGCVYAANESHVNAVDTSTGSTRWTYAVSGLVVSSPVVVDGATVCFGSTEGFVYAVRA